MARYALVLLLAAPLLAQTPRYQEEVTVTEVTLDLVVIDRKGDRITGLTAADFEVLEDGRPVTITYFREIDASRKGRPRGSAISAQGETAPAVSEPRTAFIFLDNADIARTARTPLFDSLKTSVVEMMASGVEVSFFLWTGRLEVIQPHDAATAVEILQELKTNGKMRRAGAGRDNFRVGTLEFDDPDLGMARQVGRSRSFRLFEAFDAAAKIVAKAPGRRILVLASRGFGVPVTDAEIAEAERAAIETVPDHPLAVEGPHFAPEVMIPTHGGNSRGNSIEDWVAAIANRHGIAIYGMFSGGLEAGTRTGITEREVRVVQRPSANPSSPFVPPRALAQLSNETGSMIGIAERTGGTATGATSKFGPFLDQVEADLNHYYTIAYRSSAELRFRKLEVRSTNLGLKVRHREAALPDQDPVTR